MEIEIVITSKRAVGFFGGRSYRAFIRIGEMQETVYIPTGTWRITEYKKQWKEGIERLKTHDTSCLVTGFTNKNGSPGVDWWPLYRVGDRVYVQNHVLWHEIYQERVGDKPFTRETCYDFVPPRRTKDYEGTEISEWSVPYEN